MKNPGFSPESYQDEPVRYPPLQVVDLVAESDATDQEYSNVVINSVNRHCLRLAVFDGDFPWHHHPSSDELFLVVEGCLLVDLVDGQPLLRGVGGRHDLR